METRMKASRPLNILGFGEPFATRWSLALTFGALVYVGYRLVNRLIVMQFDFSTQIAYTIPIYYGFSVLLMLSLFGIHKLFCFPDIRIFGDIRRKYVMRGLLAVTLLYITTHGIELWLGQSRETIMVLLYSQKTLTQNIVMVISLLILPPIVEELAFRHFLLSVLPFNANRKIALIAIVATSAFFSVQHHYDYLTSYLLLFVLGIVFSLARIRSKGLALPIILHSYAIALALICDQIIMYIEN